MEKQVTRQELLIKMTNSLSEFLIKEVPDGWEKHNALCNLQQVAWWSLKGMDQATPVEEVKND